MANENPTPGGLPEKAPGYRKITKITSDTTSSEHQEQETREEVSGRYEKRLVTSKTREAKTSLIEIFEPSVAPAISAALPAAWRADLPSKVRIRLTGVQPAGCADAGEFDGEYILELIEARPEQCRWELTLPPKCHLYRICLVARAEGDAVNLRAFFEGSEQAPAWVATINAAQFDSTALAFDSFSAANPCAGCQWPAAITAEAIPSERAYISPDPTVAELGATATIASSGCSSGGSSGYSILGPRHVPGLSEYTYGLDFPAGANVTNIAWTVNKSTAEISGPNNQVQVNVIFENTRPDYIQLKASFDSNGAPESVRICIALVQVLVDRPLFTNPGTPAAITGGKASFLSTIEPPNCVVDNDPGSVCNAFTCAPAAAAPQEFAVKVESDSSGGPPAFVAVANVALIAPPQVPDALQHIQVGWIQTGYQTGKAALNNKLPN